MIGYSELNIEVQGNGLKSYKRGDCLIIPKPNEKAVAFGYLMLDRQDLLKRIFHEGVPSLTWFMEWAQKPDSTLLGCYKLPDMDLRGFGWIVSTKCLVGSSPENDVRKAEIGEAFFRGIPVQETHAFGDLMIDWAFLELGMTLLLGSTPEPNRAALAYAKDMGFIFSGSIPNITLWNGRPCTARISYLTRDMWEEIRTKGGKQWEAPK